MTRRTEKTLEEQCEKVTSRFDRRYAQKLARHCDRSGMKPAQLVRFAAMVFIDFECLDLVTKVQKVEDELAGFRKDFNEAVIREED